MTDREHERIPSWDVEDFDEEFVRPLRFSLETPVSLGEDGSGTEYWGGEDAFVYAGDLFNQDGSVRDHLAAVYLKGSSSLGVVRVRVNPDGTATYVTDSACDIPLIGTVDQKIDPASLDTLTTGEPIVLFEEAMGPIDSLEEIVAVDKRTQGYRLGAFITNTIATDFSDLVAIAVPIEEVTPSDLI